MKHAYIKAGEMRLRIELICNQKYTVSQREARNTGQLVYSLKSYADHQPGYPALAGENELYTPRDFQKKKKKIELR